MLVASPLPLLPLLLWPSLPFLGGFSGTGQKAAPPARLGLQSPRGSGLRSQGAHGLPRGCVLLSVDSGAGFAAPVLCRGYGTGSPPPHPRPPPPPRPAQKALFWGGRRGFCSAGAAFAEAQGPATAALCTREVCLGAEICLANREPVPLPRYARGLVPSPGASLP